MSVVWTERRGGYSTSWSGDKMAKRRGRKPKTEVIEVVPIHHPVLHPVGYTQGKIECWDYIIDQNFGFFAGTVVKYIARYRFKGTSIDDLKKARQYLNKLITTLESGKIVS